jgi:predicted nucleotidyltransferase
MRFYYGFLILKTKFPIHLKISSYYRNYIMESKEDKMLMLFFNYPSREWHFEEILKEGEITRSKATRWLKLFAKKSIIRRVKERSKMPYYISDYDSPSYQNKKRIFALSLLYDSGLLNHLSSLEDAKTVILFGSFSRWDWHESSDIDLFIYGNPIGLKLSSYEEKLGRDAQVFICRDKKELYNLGDGLLRNIIKGDILKGDINFLEVK